MSSALRLEVPVSVCTWQPSVHLDRWHLRTMLCTVLLGGVCADRADACKALTFLRQGLPPDLFHARAWYPSVSGEIKT